MKYRILGPLEVVDGHRVVQLSPRLRDVLAVLLSRPNTPVSIDRLADELWGETPPKSAVKTVQVYVHHLRRHLGGRRSIEHRAGGYVLVTEPGTLDAVRFEELVMDGRAAIAARDYDGGVGLLRQALALWSGPAFDGQTCMPRVREEAARLSELRQTVTEERIEAELKAGRHRELVSELKAAVAENPLRERLRAQLMLALHRSGRRAEALAAYREGRTALAAELGLDPGWELRRMERAILSDASNWEDVTSPDTECPLCHR